MVTAPEPPPERLRPQPKRDEPRPDPEMHDALVGIGDEEHPDFSAEYDHASGRIE
jgi:hypothetical protein